MPMQTLSPTDVAALLGVHSATVRRWAAAHARHLSAGANPAHGRPRTFTHRDVEVLRAAAELRSEGLAGSQLDARLGDLTIPDAVESAQDVAQATQTAQDATDRTALVPIALYAADRARWAAQEAELHARIEELQRELGRMEGQQRKRPAWWVKLFGGEGKGSGS